MIQNNNDEQRKEIHKEDVRKRKDPQTVPSIASAQTRNTLPYKFKATDSKTTIHLFFKFPPLSVEREAAG